MDRNTVLLSMIMTFVGVYGFSVLYTAPGKERIFCGIGGAISWLVEAVTLNQGWHLVSSAVLAALVLTMYARFCAVCRKQPATIYLLPSIFPLVPGASIYYGAYHFIIGDTATAMERLLETVETAMALALGIILGMALPIFRLTKENREKADT